MMPKFENGKSDERKVEVYIKSDQSVNCLYLMDSALPLCKTQIVFVSYSLRFGHRPDALLNSRQINNKLTIICTVGNTCHSNGEFSKMVAATR